MGRQKKYNETESVLLYLGDGTEYIQKLDVTHRASYSGIEYGYAQTRSIAGPIEVGREVGGDHLWKPINPIGQHHSTESFRPGQRVWVSLASHLYRAILVGVPRANAQTMSYRFGFLSEDDRITGVADGTIDQIVLLSDWKGVEACPYPRFDMLKANQKPSTNQMEQSQ